MLVLAAAAFAGSPVQAADAAYLGAWRIISARVAPWADPRERAPDRAEARALVGRIVRFTPQAITGPKVFACRRPQYRLVEWPAEMLFQGAFDEMRRQDPRVDPLKLAQSLGFQGTSWKSLETGCEFDWHFVSLGEMETSLNDYVYFLRKE